MKTTEDFKGYIKYFGPFTEDGSLDILKAGKSLLALDRFSKKYQKESLKLDKDSQYTLKISEVNKNCSEIIIIITEVLKSNPVNFALVGLGLKAIGVAEFGKQFFGTLGQQLALKVFSKGKDISKEKDFIKNGEIFVELKNNQGEKKNITAQEWENFQKLNSSLDGFVQLEKGKEEEMKVGYKEGEEEKQVAVMKYIDKDYFGTYSGLSLEERMNEAFDETNAKEETIVGKFVDFYGLAHKYHFAFQARRKQDDVGKQKILCIVAENQISTILDYLKPEFDKNVCIFGKAIRDWDNKVDKMKIEWVNEDENYNPNQMKIE